MPVIKRQETVPYTAEQMYQLVNDIEKYPEFLPWCEASEILSASEDEVRASVTLAKGALKKSFTTCNRLQHNKMIEVRLVSGPFRQLEGFWLFEDLHPDPEQSSEPAKPQSRVSLDLEFEFSNKLVSMAVGPIFGQIANNFVDIFCKRAKEVHG